jgi:putative transposase
MAEVKIKNKQWQKIRAFLDENPRVYVGQERQSPGGEASRCRKFVEGVLWVLRSGAQWRLLPKRYGNCNSVYKRFDRWSERGVWQEMFEHFADNPDMESVMLDSSVIRAHACSAGAPHKKGDKQRRHSAIVEGALERAKPGPSGLVPQQQDTCERRRSGQPLMLTPYSRPSPRSAARQSLA